MQHPEKQREFHLELNAEPEKWRKSSPSSLLKKLQEGKVINKLYKNEPKKKSRVFYMQISQTRNELDIRRY